MVFRLPRPPNCCPAAGARNGAGQTPAPCGEAVASPQGAASAPPRRSLFPFRVYLKSLYIASFGGKSALLRRFPLQSIQNSCKKTACMTPFPLEIHTTYLSDTP